MAKIVVANWKMNKSLSDARMFVQTLIPRLKSFSNVPMVVCPSFPLLYSLRVQLPSFVHVGCQNIGSELTGAFTGEVSVLQVKDVCSHVVIGHSERRQLFGETSVSVNKKLKLALTHNLVPILCVGETLAERERGLTESVLASQLSDAIQGLTLLEISRMWFAYEPVWAIGTGKTASVNEIHTAHAFIQSKVGLSACVLYGGSVSPTNVADILSIPVVAGVLVGSASLNADSFLRLVECAVTH